MTTWEVEKPKDKTVKSSKQLSLEVTFVQMHPYPRAYRLLIFSYADKGSCKKTSVYLDTLSKGRGLIPVGREKNSCFSP